MYIYVKVNSSSSLQRGPWVHATADTQSGFKWGTRAPPEHLVILSRKYLKVGEAQRCEMCCVEVYDKSIILRSSTSNPSTCEHLSIRPPALLRTRLQNLPKLWFRVLKMRQIRPMKIKFHVQSGWTQRANGGDDPQLRNARKKKEKKRKKRSR